MLTWYVCDRLLGVDVVKNRIAFAGDSENQILNLWYLYQTPSLIDTHHPDPVLVVHAPTSQPPTQPSSPTPPSRPSATAPSLSPKSNAQAQKSPQPSQKDTAPRPKSPTMISTRSMRGLKSVCPWVSRWVWGGMRGGGGGRRSLWGRWVGIFGMKLAV